MQGKPVSIIILSLLVVSASVLAFYCQPVKSDYAWTETIYIRADGSIQPSTAPISSVDNVTYTLTDNITGNVPDYASAIIIQRDNIIAEGAGHTLNASTGWASHSKGIELTGRSNVTIKNMKITVFYYGIWLNSSPYNSVSGNNIIRNTFGIYLGSSNNNSISGNNITDNHFGIELDSSSNNSVSGNNITANNDDGLWLDSSSNNSISGNNIKTNAYDGIQLYSSSNNNSISGNNITDNYFGIELDSSNNSASGNNIANNLCGIALLFSSFGNTVYSNNFINNTYQTYSSGSVNFWDDGYPSGGNYWSNYTGLDQKCGPSQDHPGSDRIGDTPYVIDANNTDHYPLMQPWVPYENGAIYIRADGSVDPSGAPIVREGDTYSLTSNITSNSDGIMIERNNMILDGIGYTVEGTNASSSRGIDLNGRSNVTIENIGIKGFIRYGIFLNYSFGNIISGDKITSRSGLFLLNSSGNYIVGNNIVNNWENGIYLDYSSGGNSIHGNNITDNFWGVDILRSLGNNIAGNNITNNRRGVSLISSSSNTISGNYAANNNYGIYLSNSSVNSVFHNSFANNTVHAYAEASANVWDDGYPSGGNYWSDYMGTDTEKGPYQNIAGSDGIGDTAYVIDANNTDNYPLSPSTQPPHDIGIFNPEQWKTVVFQGFPLCTYGSTINYGNNSENISIIAYANGIPFDSKNSTLQAKTWNTTGFTFTSKFGWNTTSLAKSVNYSLSFYVEPVPGETDTADNNFTSGWVVVSMPGDLTGGTSNPWDFVPDGKVDGKDIAIVALCYGSAPGCQPPWIWNPNSDVNNDGKVDGKDIALVAIHFGEANFP